MSGSDARFGTVAILAPLPNGDRAFTVEFARHKLRIRAGKRLDFTCFVAAGVETFRITVIDTGARVDVINPPKSIARYDLV